MGKEKSGVPTVKSNLDSEKGRLAFPMGLITDTMKTLYGSKSRSFYQASVPTSTGVGDLWFDTDDGFKVYRATNIGDDQVTAGEWVTVRDGDISQLRTDIGNGTITLSNLSTYSGVWYNNTGVLLSATAGIVLYGGQVSLRTYATYANYTDNPTTTIQCSVDTNGAITAGGGAIALNATGIEVKGLTNIKFYDGTTYIYSMGSNALGLWITGQVSGYPLTLSTTGTDDIDIAASGDLNLTAGSANFVYANYLASTYAFYVPRLSSPPTGYAGAVYHNTTDHKFYAHNGTSWVAFA
jgi:hypothetical protein